MKRLHRFAALALAALTAVPPALVAQAPPQPAQPQIELPSFDEIIDVRVVNLEVVVTDRQGNRVTDLNPSDFRLKIDKQEVPIAFFTEVREGQAVAPAAASGPEDEAPAPVQNVSPGGTVGTNYLVFIDDYFSVALRRNEVLKSLKDQLSRLGPQDRMSLIAFDGARLDRISGWTASATDLAKAFDEAMARPTRGLDRISEKRSFLSSESFEVQINAPMIGRSGSPGPVAEAADPTLTVNRATDAGLSLQEKAYGSTLVRQVDGAVSAAVSAMRGSAAPQGRKVMLLLSGGWPFSIESFLRGPNSVVTSTELPRGDQTFAPLTSAANLLGYTIYPVDLPGIETAAADAESGNPSGGIDSLREQEVEGSVHFLAQQTGGRPILNSRRNEALQTVVADTRSYYWLGFSPTWQRNDGRHKIAIEVLRPGLKARTRNDFLDLSFKTEMGMLLESALLFGSLPNTVPMPMRAGTPERNAKGDTEIPLTLGFPVDALTVIPTNGKYVGKVELRIAAADEHGNRSEVVSLPLDLASDKPPKAGGFVKYETKIKLHGKASRIAAVSYDMLSGKMAAGQILTP